jgi:hypothetical protein
MRWSDLFDHLETESAQGQAALQKTSIDRHRATTTFLSCLTSAKKNRISVSVGLVSGDILTVTPRSVGREWFTGIIGREDGSALLVPLHAIDWISNTAQASDTGGSVTAVGITEVLVDLARRRVPVVCECRGGIVRGVITAVGGDWFDLAPGDGGAGDRCRRVAIPGLVCLRYGNRSWG